MEITNQNSAGGIGARGERLAIMIPNYNGAAYIAETLRSLQAQGDAIADAQIEVVDNVSTDNSEQVVRDTWGERVVFHRNAENIGMVPNFNRCVERATRPWVHILHSDDLVLPGAYEEWRVCTGDVPNANIALGRCVYIDEAGVWDKVGEPLGTGVRGVLGYRPYRWAMNPVNFVGVLFQKSAAERVGGFNADYTYTSDWDLWWRICQDTKSGDTVYTNHCVGAYRVFAGNATSGFRVSGEDLRQSVAQARRIYDASSGAVECETFFRPAVGAIFWHVLTFAMANPAGSLRLLQNARELPPGAISLRDRLRLRRLHAQILLRVARKNSRSEQGCNGN